MKIPCDWTTCEGEVRNLDDASKLILALWLIAHGVHDPIKAGRCTRCGMGSVLGSETWSSQDEEVRLYAFILPDGALVPGPAVARADKVVQAGGPVGFLGDFQARWLEAIVREAAELEPLVKIPNGR